MKLNKKKTICIIGGSGYIGQELSAFFLKKNYKVISLDGLIFKGQKNYIRNKNYKFIKCRINEKEKILNITKNINNIVYLAGLVGDPLTKKYPKLGNTINLTQSKKIINEILKQNNKKFIFVSTCSNYGLDKSNKLLNENSELNPLSSYAKCKVEIEKYLMKKKIDKNKVAILRFATAFGLSKRMRFDLTINEFILDAYLNKKIEVYDSDTWRPYCHIRDFSEIIFRIFKTNKKFNKIILNAGDQKNNYTKRYIANEISKYIKNIEIINRDRKDSDRRNYRVNFNRIKNFLNFNCKYDLKYGIIEIINYVKKNSKIIKKSRNIFGNYVIKNANIFK